jgi:hypothetical protein
VRTSGANPAKCAPQSTRDQPRDPGEDIRGESRLERPAYNVPPTTSRPERGTFGVTFGGTSGRTFGGIRRAFVLSRN